MAIQMRRGEYDDFDASKMLAGELAVVVSGDPETEGGALYVATAAGSATRVAFASEVPTEDATTTSDGLMSAADKSKLDGVAAGAQANVIESVSVNGNSATVTGKAAVVTIPEATDAASGVMGAGDKAKLNGIEAGANAYTLPAATTAALGGVKPDGTTVTVDNDGTIHAAGSGTIPDGSITGIKIADDTIPDAKLAQTGGVLSAVYDQTINAGTPSAEYYSNNNGIIATTANASSKGYVIDLSDYEGEYVCVRFTSTATTSSRMTALCGSDGTIYNSITEQTMTGNGGKFYVFVTSTAYMLYVSFHNALVSGFKVECLSGLVGEVTLMREGLLDVVYVSTTGSDSNPGTPEAPLATIQKGVTSGASLVRVKPGTYGKISIVKREKPITIEPWPDVSTATNVSEQMVTVTGSSGVIVEIKQCADVTLRNILADADETSAKPFYIDNTTKLLMERCKACDSIGSGAQNGISLLNSNGILRECEAWNVEYDGFNFHGYGNTVLIDCVAHDCGDDGVSHHNQCTGTVIGGEFYGCGKGGVATPTHGATVDVLGVYSHDNTRYGLYVASDTGIMPSRSMVSGCAFVDNGTADIYVANATVVGWNNRYGTKSTGTDGTYTDLDA